MDLSQHDRLLVTNSTGRQCIDLHEKDESVITDAGLVKDPARDENNMHIVNVGSAVIDTPYKNNACHFSDDADLSAREPRPCTISSGRQSPFVNDDFVTTRCNRPQPDCSGRRSPHCQSLAEDVETYAVEEVSNESRPDYSFTDRNDIRSSL